MLLCPSVKTTHLPHVTLSNISLPEEPQGYDRRSSHCGLADNEGKSGELRRLARTVAESQVNIAKTAQQQQKDLLDAQLRELGEEAVEEAEVAVVEEPSEDDKEEEIDLIINAEVDKDGDEISTEVRMKVSTLKAAIRRPNVTLLHAVAFALQQNEQNYLHGGFGNETVLKQTDGDMDAVVPVIARFHKQRGPYAMKMGLVYRTDVAVLFESCSVYTCKLTMAEKGDVNLQYMISGLSAEYDPIYADRRSPKRDPSHLPDGGNGFRNSKMRRRPNEPSCSRRWMRSFR